MSWKAVKLQPMPGQGEAWYVSDGGENLLYCGSGDDAKAKARAEMVANKIELGEAAALSQYRDYHQTVMTKLRDFNSCSIHLNPQMLPEVGQQNPIYSQLRAIEKLHEMVLELQRLLMDSPVPKK
jgi:hypothetical protein